MQFQITLKAARVNLGLTLKEAAKKFNIHHETLANYESDSTNVPRGFFIQLEKIYGIPPESIYFGKQEDYIFNLKNQLKIKQHA